MKPLDESNLTPDLDTLDSPIGSAAAHLSIEPKKKRHIVRNVITTLFVLAFLAAASYIGWLLVKPLEPAQQTTTTNETVIATL